MIHTNRIVTVGEQESIIDRPIVLYRGDREVEIEFTLVGNEFTFSEEGNVIKSVNASHGQLVLNTPSGEHMFSELAECHEGKVVFVVTKEMIDEFIEMGFYSFQIRLYDSAEMKSRVTIPPVMNGFDIRNPIAAEDETNVVDQSIVDYARIFKDQSNEELPTFDWTGAYNKTEWVHHDVITENKMNKIEDAIWTINNKISESDNVFLKKAENIEKQRQNDVNKLNAKDNELSKAITDGDRVNANAINQLRVDMEVADAGVKNELSLHIDEKFDEQLRDKVESQVNQGMDVDYDLFLSFDINKPIIGYIDNDKNLVLLNDLHYGEYTLYYNSMDDIKTKIASFFNVDENTNLLEAAQLYLNQRYSQTSSSLVESNGTYTIIFPIDTNVSQYNLQLIDLDIEVPLTTKGSTLYMNNADFTNVAYTNDSNYIALMTSGIIISDDGRTAEIVFSTNKLRNYIILSVVVKNDIAITHNDIANHLIKITALD